VSLSMIAIACGGGTSAADKTATSSAGKPAATATAAPAPTSSTPFQSPTAGPAGTDSEKEQTVAVSLTEWKITGAGGAALGPVKAGEIKFDVKNDGTTQHEFVLIRTDAGAANLPVEAGKVNEDTAGDSPGEADDIEAGQSKTATVRLQPGKYVYICNVIGHYQSGMRGELLVQ